MSGCPRRILLGKNGQGKDRIDRADCPLPKDLKDSALQVSLERGNSRLFL
jgi:hypothetical protein